MKNNVLELRSLRKKFGALKATDDVSLEVEKGKIHALIGPNGAGKTTLISQIFGNLKPDSGDIFLDGKSITNTSVADRALLGIGRSFQISNVLMDFSVLENAIVAKISHSQETFRFFRPAFSDPSLIEGGFAILKRVGMEQMADRKVSDLAHGERRLLELRVVKARNVCRLPNTRGVLSGGAGRQRQVRSECGLPRGWDFVLERSSADCVRAAGGNAVFVRRGRAGDQMRLVESLRDLHVFELGDTGGV